MDSPEIIYHFLLLLFFLLFIRTLHQRNYGPIYWDMSWRIPGFNDRMISMIWSIISLSRKLQFALFILIAIEMTKRVINIWEPFVFGSIINKLQEDSTPTRQIYAWVGCRMITSYGGLSAIHTIIIERFDAVLEKSLFVATYRHSLALSMDYHLAQGSSTAQVIEDSKELLNLLHTVFFRLIPQCVDVVAALLFISSEFDVKSSIILVLTAFAHLWLQNRAETKTTPIYQRYKDSQASLRAHLNQCIRTWLDVKAFGREAHEQQVLETTFTEVTTSRGTWSMVWVLARVVQSSILHLAMLIVVLSKAWKVSNSDGTAGDFVSLYTYWNASLAILQQTSSLSTQAKETWVSSERVRKFLMTESSVTDSTDAPHLELTEGEIYFNKVGFGYEENNQLLHNITFRASRGQILAICGASGSGKSTLFRLLLRFYDPTEGSISIDGQDIRNITLESLRKSIGIVPQQVELQDDTLMANVRYARLEATEKEVEEACIAAGIDQQIRDFPNGYNTMIGGGGASLSNGQQQRIAIARVLLQDPPIILLDEATSAIDVETEQKIQANIKEIFAKKTVVTVSHRLNTVRDAGFIIHLKNGKIIEAGTHDMLLQRGGGYAMKWGIHCQT